MLALPGTQLNRRWHHLDRMGNLDCVTYEDNGDVVAATAYAYDAWGLPRSNVGNWGDDSAYSQDTFVWPDESTDRGFTNHEMLEAISLIHMNARLYDPVIGQFISPDSVTPAPMSAQDISRYAYVYNNPFRYIDPSGHSSVSVDYSGQKSTEVVISIYPDGEFKVLMGKEDLEKLSGEVVAELKSIDYVKLVENTLGSTSGLAAGSQSAGNAQASATSGIGLGASAQATTEDEAKQNAPQQTEAAKKADPTAQGGDGSFTFEPVQFSKGVSALAGSILGYIGTAAISPTGVGLPLAAGLAATSTAGLAYGLGNIVASFSPDRDSASTMESWPSNLGGVFGLAVGGREGQAYGSFLETSLDFSSTIRNSSKLMMLKDSLQYGDSIFQLTSVQLKVIE